MVYNDCTKEYRHTSKMASTTIVFGFFLVAAAAGAVNIAHNTTTRLTCHSSISIPGWCMNGSPVFLAPLYQLELDPTLQKQCSTGDFLGLLTIDGNEASGILDLCCVVEGRTIYTKRLATEGPLPSPEHVTLISQNFQLHWKPPYYTLNHGSAAIHVDPHVTQYTVYIFDAYTRRMMRSMNMTETSFTPTNNIPLCPMYQVSAWNPGGEGELSEPVWDSTPQVCPGDSTDFTTIAASATAASTTAASTTAASTTATSTTATSTTATSTTATSTTATSTTATSTTATSTTATSTTAVTTASSSRSGSESNNQQGNSTTLIVVVTGIFAAIVGVVIVAATVGIIYCRGHKKHKLKKREIETKPNPAYETVTLPSPSRSTAHVHTKPCPAYGVVVHTHH